MFHHRKLLYYQDGCCASIAFLTVTDSVIAPITSILGLFFLLTLVLGLLLYSAIVAVVLPLLLSVTLICEENTKICYISHFHSQAMTLSVPLLYIISLYMATELPRKASLPVAFESKNAAPLAIIVLLASTIGRPIS